MKYDVIVCGGGTAGCAFAYTAGKLGLKTLLIEKNNFLGGTMTSGLVTPAMKTSDKNINTDFYKELMNNLSNIGGQITYNDGNIGWFNPELMKIVLDEMLTSKKVDILFDSIVDDINTNDKSLISVKINNLSTKTNETIYDNNITQNNKILSEYIETKYVIDATGDAKIFQKLNCDFLENKNNFQPINLRFIMSGIDLNKFSNWILNLDKDRNVTTSYMINNEIHLSTAYTWDTNKQWALKPLFKKGIENGDITEEDSNYFQVFTIPGMPSALAFNCPRLLLNKEFNLDSKIDISKALIKGRASILRLSKFLRKYFIGFENSYISSIANSLGIRVSNRIKGRYIYTIDDLKSGKQFKNPCLVSNYPVDVHSSKKNESVLEHQYQDYSLPIESLMSCNYDNLFAIGRCISADFEAQAALRIIPSCFSMGEGLAKYIAQLEN